MLTIELRFPTGRFHATPWGHHVNEGIPEWPPSPWRVVRAFVATWKRKLPHIAEDDMRALLASLAGPPRFRVPRATCFHTRHYMPWYKKGPLDRTLAFDTFVVVERESPLLVLWDDLSLDEPQSATLDQILSALTTLGRAETWCDARRIATTEAVAAENDFFECVPFGTQTPLPDSEIIPVLCAGAGTMFANDCTPKHIATEGRGKDKRTIDTPLYDPDWNLCIETIDLHKSKLLIPPGSIWVDYARPRSCLNPPRRSRPERQLRTFTVARFALASAVLPLVTESLKVAENARIDLMGIFGRLTAKNGIKGKSRIFSGKDQQGSPIQGHRHAYYLPTDEDNDGKLDHLTLYAADGFGKEELRALDKLSVIKQRKKREDGHPLEVVLLGVGSEEDYRPGPLGTHREWVSATPFVAPRHPKTRGRQKEPAEHLTNPTLFLKSQVRREIQRWVERTGTNIDPDRIEITPVVDEDGTFRGMDANGDPTGPRPIQFKRFRQKQGDDGGRRRAGFFRITFPEPVSGPIALGHSCHFGLGLFIPDED